MVKVEVKGTTSQEVDEVLMTANEVALHQREAGETGLLVVRGITLLNRGENPVCSGGQVDAFLPWDISTWELIPRAFSVARPGLIRNQPESG
jgi:hypothetical protein